MKARTLAAMLLLGVMTAACQSSVARPAPVGPPSGSIIIASDLPVGANQSALAAERAVRLAIDEQKTIGGFKLAYWSLDDSVGAEYSPETGIENVNWMLEVPQVLGMVGPFPSSVAEVTIPVANPQDLVMISPANTRPCLTQLGPTCSHTAESFRPSGHVNYFRIAPPDPMQGLAMARYAATNLQIKRVAVINEWGRDGQLIIGQFSRELQRHGGEVVLSRDNVASNTGDFREFVAAAISDQAQAIYAAGDTTGGICVLRAQMPPDLVFLGTDGVANDDTCIAQAANRTRSIVATYEGVDIRTSSAADAQKELHAYYKAYPGASVDDFTFAAYDCAKILIAAITKAMADAGGSVPNRRQVLEAMAGMNYTGVTGTYSFDANGDALAPLMEIYDVENGKWVNKGKIDASAATT